MSKYSPKGGHVVWVLNWMNLWFSNIYVNLSWLIVKKVADISFALIRDSEKDKPHHSTDWLTECLKHYQFSKTLKMRVILTKLAKTNLLLNYEADLGEIVLWHPVTRLRKSSSVMFQIMLIFFIGFSYRLEIFRCLLLLFNKYQTSESLWSLYLLFIYYLFPLSTSSFIEWRFLTKTREKMHFRILLQYIFHLLEWLHDCCHGKYELENIFKSEI